MRRCSTPIIMCSILHRFFFFTDTAPTEIYTLSLHDALPIYRRTSVRSSYVRRRGRGAEFGSASLDRKSTRLNSSHVAISYAVFCLKKKIDRKRGPPLLRLGPPAAGRPHAGEPALSTGPRPRP